jgi:membrane protease YdiL (CAAX protease family)
MDPNTEFPAQEVLPPTPEPATAIPQEPHREPPRWSGIDLLIAAVAFVIVLFVATSTLLIIQMHTAGASYAQLAKNPGALVVVPAMIAAYMALLATLYFRASIAQARQFWDALSWHWPSGKWLAVFLGLGAFMAISLPLLSRLLPFPKSIPLDRFFRDPRAAYLMVFMGVVVAPFAEEVSFRGVLYPVLDRWLQTALAVRQRLFSGSKWLLLMAAWGYLIHRIATTPSLPAAQASALSIALAMFAIVPVAFFSFTRWLKSNSAATVFLPGLAVCIWGLLLRSTSPRVCLMGTAVVIGLAFFGGIAGGAGALSLSMAGRVGRILAVLLTSSVFAMVHSEQLGGAWGPLLLIFLVGLVLTITRVVTRSVAPGFLIHMAYNFTLFASVYLGTDHFRHLERISQ